MTRFNEKHYLDPFDLFDFLGLSGDRFYPELNEEYKEYILPLLGDVHLAIPVKENTFYDLASVIEDNFKEFSYRYLCDQSDREDRILTLMALLVDHCCFTKFYPKKTRGAKNE